MKLMAFPFVAVAVAVAVASTQDAKGPDHIILTPDEVKWADAPPSLPPGAKAAVIEGNPAKPGFFTMRLKFPANYELPPHYHPAVEHVTVLSGCFNISPGDKFDRSKTKALKPGGFAVMEIGVKHFAWTSEETVLQLHGMGPWGLTYVNASDDPRNKK